MSLIIRGKLSNPRINYKKHFFLYNYYFVFICHIYLLLSFKYLFVYFDVLSFIYLNFVLFNLSLDGLKMYCNLAYYLSMSYSFCLLIYFETMFQGGRHVLYTIAFHVLFHFSFLSTFDNKQISPNHHGYVTERAVYEKLFARGVPACTRLAHHFRVSDTSIILGMHLY